MTKFSKNQGLPQKRKIIKLKINGRKFGFIQSKKSAGINANRDK